jgi:peptidyl-prolyl cis-trans isomerase B (cyclophilin B)
VEFDGEEVDGWVRYPRAAVAMANTGQPDSAGSQFFIVQGEPDVELEAIYATFGEVVEGMDVVDDVIAGPAVEQLAIDPVIVTSVTIEQR